MVGGADERWAGIAWQRQVVVDGDVDLVADIDNDEAQDADEQQDEQVGEQCGQEEDGVQQHEGGQNPVPIRETDELLRC